jgi:hypothetical protein
MRRETLIKNLLFDVDPVSLEAIVRDCPTLGSGHLPPSRTLHCITPNSVLMIGGKA